MEIDLRSGEVCLQDNQPVRLNSARGLRVTCTAGRVWITETGVTEDIFLHPGQSHQIGSDALALIESIGGGKVCFEPAQQLALLKRMRETIEHVTRPIQTLSVVIS